MWWQYEAYFRKLKAVVLEKEKWSVRSVCHNVQFRKGGAC
jgi:hypothetical protein